MKKETYRKPKSQTLQSLDPKDYQVRIVVFGSRFYYDKRQFHEHLMDYLEQFDQPILFISGDASTGADAMIVQWSRKFKYPCLRMPADWDALGKGAGFVRNTEMAKICTHGLGYWDGVSGGTKQMRSELDRFNTPFKIHAVITNPPEKN